MRRYLVVAHKTLGDPHLMAHLHRLREEDPYCRFHLVVPVQHPHDHAWSEGEVRAAAERKLDEMLSTLASMSIGADGEVGDANPVYAIGTVLNREGRRAFAGIVLSTLPRDSSRWWLFNVPRRVARSYPWIPLTHLTAEDALVP